jgi:hypothetical protein
MTEAEVDADLADLRRDWSPEYQVDEKNGAWSARDGRCVLKAGSPGELRLKLREYHWRQADRRTKVIRRQASARLAASRR